MKRKYIDELGIKYEDTPILNKTEIKMTWREDDMKYRGFKIEVKKADEGYCMTIYRLSDGWILADEWNPSINTKSEAIEE